MIAEERSFSIFVEIGLLAPPVSLSSIKIVSIVSLVTGSRKHVSGTSFSIYDVGSTVERGTFSLILVPIDEKNSLRASAISFCSDIICPLHLSCFMLPVLEPALPVTSFKICHDLLAFV